jgi:hypothetical protein
MATSNFHNENASHIFAVEIENEWDYEDLFDNLYFEFKNVSEFCDVPKVDHTELRSFPSTGICSLRSVVSNDEGEIEISVTPVVRSGYYSGVNLDWHDEFYTDGKSTEDLVLSAELEKARLVDIIENIFSNYSEKLGVTARFSNGETIYHKVA